MSTSWQAQIDTIKNGEAVDSTVTNRPIEQLTARTDLLKLLVDTNGLGKAIFLDSAPISTDVKTGFFVYWDEVNQVFAPAFAAITLDKDTLVPSESSRPVGLVIKKHTSQSAAIVLSGVIDPTQYIGDDCSGLNLLTNLFPGQDMTAGTYFLAAGLEYAGTVSTKAGLVNVPVCQYLNANMLVVNPQIPGMLDTQAIKVPIKTKVFGPDLIIQRVDNTNTILSLTSQFDSYYKDKKVVLYTSADSGSTAVDVLIYGKAKVDVAGSIGLTDVTTTAAMVKRLYTNMGNYATALLASGGVTVCLGLANDDGSISTQASTRIVLCNSTSLSCYVPPVSLSSNRWAISATYAGALADSYGWAPATSVYFPNEVIPAGAKFGYKYEKHPILGHLFPEELIGTYLISKRGKGISPSVVKVDQYGIWWFDDFLELPWTTISNNSILPDTNIDMRDWTPATSSQIIMPTDLELYYAKVVSGGVRVVSSLTTDPNSILKITDIDGNPASTGPLRISADFTISSSDGTTAGSNVVKGFNGFEALTGPVVEQIIAGENIAVTSNGQGKPQVSVVGLDGKLEGEPDTLSIDDVRVEKDATLDIFYFVMPNAKNSSILGKVIAPTYLSGDYKLNIVIRALALHSANPATIPALTINWTIAKDASAGVKSLNSDTSISGSTFSAVSLNPREYIDLSLASNMQATVTAGQTVYFNIKRSSTDNYTAPLGIISIKYQFTKV